MPPVQVTTGLVSSSQAEQLRSRIAASIENWKRKLLDLTKRNRLLHFRINRVSTITVVDELPTEVFRRLYIAEQLMRFMAAPEEIVNDEPSGAAPAEIIDRGLSVEDESSDPIDDLLEDTSSHAATDAYDFMPYDRASLHGRHTDDWLQTTATAEQLDRSLRRLDEQARSTIEEQGVNTLFLTLGMLHYTESADSDEVFRAPLILLPVELSRASARSTYQLRIADDEPMVNPALVEHLRRMGVRLPELPEAQTMPDDYDLQTFFTATAGTFAERPKWSVKTDIHVGLFSFQKFVMFKDLEANAGPLSGHRLVQQLVGRSGEQIAGLPEDIRRLDLDEEFPPEKSFQVVDADSSQLRAIAACARGYDLVIEGPPGTGKSQTITNLIAQALGEGKTVLFVAEKMAALSVVHSRLVKAGLGEFCLELHSGKANKRLVMRDIAATLDASFQNVASTRDASDRLPQVRATLSEYVRALHTPFGTLGLTPYDGYGALASVRSAPPTRLAVSIDDVRKEDFDRTVRELEDLAVAAGPVGNPAAHPWRETERTFYTESDLEAVRLQASDLVACASDVMAHAAAVETRFGLAPVRTPRDVATAAEVVAIIGGSPGASLKVLQSDTWNTPPAEATRILELGRELARLRERLTSWFSADVLEHEHADDIAYVERKASGTFSFLAILDSRYRAVRRRWKSYRLSSYSKSLIDQANDLKTVDCCRSLSATLRKLDSEARDLFGALWAGESSDWEALGSYIDWVVEFRKACVTHALSAAAYEVAAQQSPDTSAMADLDAALGRYAASLTVLRHLVEWPEQHFASDRFDAVRDRAGALGNSVWRGPEWAAFEACRKPVSSGLAAELLAPAMRGELPFGLLAPVFRRAFLMKWLGVVVRARPPLERFHSLSHEQRVKEFQELDTRVLQENQAALIQQLRDASQQRLQGEEARQGLPHLRSQLNRQRNVSPLRRTMHLSGATIRAIKPCFMMSPMTVAQLVSGAQPTFDVVIFDEASQLPSEDAVGAMIRGRQLVVVGDPKQLPPTNFFAVTTGQTVTQLDDDGNPLFDDSESVLEEFMGAGVPMSRLKWHYRSAHETLISFSNVSFYDTDLYTFPSIVTDTSRYGLCFEYLADARYEGKGLNLVEARRVADEVVRFAREQAARERRGERPLSLGVGTFNLRQQIAIQDELEQRRRQEPLIDAFFSPAVQEPFFVKNLENIQGDERDVIFLSVTYGPGTDGRIRYNFGPLNGENGWRRLNVLVTRARQRMLVFSSMRGEDINPTAAVSAGPRLLRDFLTFAEHGRLDGIAVVAAADTESPFEREVFTELTSRGIRVVPQVGTSGYRIDLGVLDDEVQGRFLCGIECDGVAYHASETARDRDRLRQQVLEARGWTIHRVWSTDWFKDRQGQLERLLRLIERERAQVREQDQAEREAGATRAREAAATAARQAEEQAREPEDVRRAAASASQYERPVATPYVMAGGRSGFAGQDILVAPSARLREAIRYVVEIESPIHEEDLLTRVAAMWDTRVGARVRARIERECNSAARDGIVELRGQFYWNPGGTAPVRLRAGMRAQADRIAPEEYEQAVLAILSTGHSFPRPELVMEVRAVLGFSRTGALLEQAINAVVERLLASGALGEGSAGLRVRGQSSQVD